MSDRKPGSDTEPNQPHPDAPAGGRRKPANDGGVGEGPIGDAALNEEAEKNDEGIDRSKTPGRTFDV